MTAIEFPGHLLLMVRQSAERPGLPDSKVKFLCGHDERHWFVAGVPETAPVSNVFTAKEALKPELVRNLESGKRGKRAKRQRRKTETFIRQGEWFFVPAPGVSAAEKLVLRNEPLRRGRGKPHNCECLYRVGGTTVYVCGQHPNGLTEKERRELIQRNAAAAKWNWQVMRRDPVVFVRGRVSHADHATIHLDGRHRSGHEHRDSVAGHGVRGLPGLIGSGEILHVHGIRPCHQEVNPSMKPFRSSFNP